jgi:hypothetical protein
MGTANFRFGAHSGLDHVEVNLDAEFMRALKTLNLRVGGTY